jgi:hypothetical protein
MTNVTVAQVTSNTAGNINGSATIQFAETPANGHLIIFLVGINHTAAVDIAPSPGTYLLYDSGSVARVYYTWYSTGDNDVWAFGGPGGTCSVIAYDLDTGGKTSVIADGAPFWLQNFTVGTGNGESEPSVSTTSAATGGLAISFLAVADDSSIVVTDAGPWDAMQTLDTSDALVYADTAPAVASSTMTAAWTVTGAYFADNGIVFVVLPYSGVDPPAPSTGSPQFSQAAGSATLSGSPGFAGGHTGTVEWTWPQGTPPVTSGASSNTATISNVGTPHALSVYTYNYTVTQDDGQVVADTVTVTVAPPPVFRAFGTPVDITLAQMQFVSPATINSNTQSVSIQTTAGNTLVLCVSAKLDLDEVVSIVSITDTGGNDWQYSTSTVSQSPPANGSYYTLNQYYGFAAIAYCIDAASTRMGGSITVTLNQAINANPENELSYTIVVYEFAGVPAGSVLDGASSGASTTSNEVVQSLFTEGIVSDIVVAVANSNGGFVSVNEPYVLGPSSETAYGIPASPGEQVVTLLGPFSEEMNGWGILAIGNPSFEGIAWYSGTPAKKASSGSWS